MEQLISQSPLPQPTPVVAPITPPSEIVPPSMPPQRSPLIAVVIALMVLIGLGGAGYWYMHKSGTNKSQEQTEVMASTIPASHTTQTEIIVEKSENLLLYTRNLTPDEPGDTEVWLIDPQTKKEQQLDFPQVAEVFKNYGSSYVYYRQYDKTNGEYHRLDLSSGKDETFILITHPDPAAKEVTTIHEIGQISPDDKYFVFLADFFIDCPKPSIDPSGQEYLDGGPCQPDTSLDAPYGYYVYDVTAGKASYLGMQVRTSRWDTTNHTLYYVDADKSQTIALNVANRQSKGIDSSSYFGYFTYPLLKSKPEILKLEASTGDSGNGPAFARFSLFNPETYKEIKIDESDRWGFIQPFISVSPDEKTFIFEHTPITDGIMRSELHVYTPSDKKFTRLSPESSMASYSIHGTWISNTEYVTVVDEIDKTGYRNNDQYLVKFNTQTGDLTLLTSKNEVSSFNSY